MDRWMDERVEKGTDAVAKATATCAGTGVAAMMGKGGRGRGGGIHHDNLWMNRCMDV